MISQLATEAKKKKCTLCFIEQDTLLQSKNSKRGLNADKFFVDNRAILNDIG
jgi:hypothetical protein